MKYFKNAWDWFKNNFVSLLIGTLVFIYSWANIKSIQIKSEATKEQLICQTSCFPQQYEYIFAADTAGCWCYIDKTTLKKLGE